MLFNCKDLGLTVSNHKPQVDTPLGVVILDVHLNTESISDKPNTTCLLSNGAKIICWQTDRLQAELLMCRPNINLTSNMKVDDCWAAVWRVKAIKEIDLTVSFLCSWKEPFTRTDVGPNSGEHLDAQTFSSNNKSVTIGTQDGEMLSIRARMSNGVPSRLEKELDNLGLVTYLDKGLCVPIPNLLANEVIQIHFLIAWSSDELATWYSVDQRSEQILSTVDII